MLLSVAKSFPNFRNPVDYSTPSSGVNHHFLEFTQTQLHWVYDVIQPTHTCRLLLLLPSIFPGFRVLSNELTLCIRWLMYWVWASASILPMNTQGWFSLGLTVLIFLLSRGLPRVFSITTIQKHQFFGAQPSLWSKSFIHSLIAQLVKNTPAMQEILVQFLGQEDLLEKG